MAAVLVCVASHISVPPSGICVFCVCWARLQPCCHLDLGPWSSSLTTLGLLHPDSVFLWRGVAGLVGLQMCVPAINI